MAMRIIILGPPGTGKGTISAFIKERFGCVHISTGDLLRDEIRKKTGIGKKIESILLEGKLVGDSLVFDVLKKKLLETNGCFVLDGFPRSVEQAQMLDSFMDSLGMGIDIALEIDSSEDMIVKRLSSRRQCVKCKRIYGLDVPSKKQGVCDDCGSKTVLREDDKPGVIKKRLGIYKKNSKPLIGFYSNKKLLVKVDGNRPLGEIFSGVEKLLKKTKQEE